MNDTKTKVDTIRLQNLSYGHKQAGVLMAAVELDLFTKISEGASTVSEIAEALDLSPLNAERILVACMGIGLLEKQGDSYQNAPDAERFLVKGKKSYGEIAQEGRMVKGIGKDNCMWTWEEGNPQGTKMCMEVSEEEMTEMAEESKQMMEEQGYQPPDIDYQCRPAVFGDEKFNPPGEVNFMDVGQMMERFGQ